MIDRRRVAAALGVVLVVGLVTRRVDAVPTVIADHAGDALWTTAVVLGLALLLPRSTTVHHAITGFAISVGVEISQLWEPTWLVDLRDNDLAALVLGRGWLWGDLVRYAVGALLGWFILQTSRD